MKALTYLIYVNEDLSNNISQRIRDLRTMQNLTQSEVAHTIGINQQSYAHYENGYRKVPVKRLSALADALNTSLEELMGMNKKKKPGRLSQLEKRFDQIRSLPKKDQQLAVDMLDKIIGIS